MRQSILELIGSGNTLTTEDIVLRLAVSIVLGWFIFLSYMLSHVGTVYSRKFNVSLVALTTMTAMVMTVIGNNIALSLGMVGALSIVRFRTAIKDSRDTVYIFWTIIVGICCGVGDFTVAVLGSIALFAIMLFFGRVTRDNRVLLIIKADRSIDRNIEAAVFNYFGRKAILRTKNTTVKDAEYIYELPKNAQKIIESKPRDIISTLYSLGDVKYVNIVVQSDSISG